MSPKTLRHPEFPSTFADAIKPRGKLKPSRTRTHISYVSESIVIRIYVSLDADCLPSLPHLTPLIAMDVKANNKVQFRTLLEYTLKKVFVGDAVPADIVERVLKAVVPICNQKKTKNLMEA